MSEKNDDIVRKIKRCMDLAKSSNENEAATALKQMQALMKKYNLTESHALAYDVEESATEIDIKDRVPAWIVHLHITIGQAMDCQCMINKYYSKNASLVFLGLGSAPEIATYAFEVLYRQLKKQRRVFMDTYLTRYKRTNKIKHADAYCLGWVASVAEKVRNLNPNQEIKEKVKAYYKVKDINVHQKYKGVDRTVRGGGNTRNFYIAGAIAAADVDLFVAAGHKQNMAIEG